MGQWIQVDISTTTEGIEPVAAVLLEMNLGYVVQDAADFESFLEGKNGHWDYIEDDLMKLQHAPTIVTVYLTDKEQGVHQLAVLTRELDRLKFLADQDAWGALTYTLQGVEEEEWATAWKQYYHPVHITERLTISPQWIDYPQKPGEVVVQMDPGMAFGTGTHESTKLCLEFLDEMIQGGEEVLDIGAGSGILSIAALLLGAKKALGIDIDQVAVETAQENAKINQQEDHVQYLQGSFVDHVTGQYDMIFANIVADAVKTVSEEIPSLLRPGGSFIASGIIDERGDEVAAYLETQGLRVVERKEENGWVSLRSERADG